MAESGVSVVIPTFDRRRVLPRAVDSVLAQTWPPAEILVVDDGSTDETAELLARRYPGVRLLQQEHRGVSAARNHGIRAASGEWVAFLDSDDEWRPQKLERQLAALAIAPDHRVCHTDEIWIRNGQRVNPRRRHRKTGGWMFQRCLTLCAISPSAAVVHRSVFAEVGLFDEDLTACEDYDLWLRICARMPVLLVDEPLVVKYGGHDDQLSRRVWGMDRFRIRALSGVLSSVPLAATDRQAAIAVLLQKIDVYAAGVAKRGRRAELEALRSQRRIWEAEHRISERVSS